jgi:hypothetical protein
VNGKIFPDKIGQSNRVYLRESAMRRFCANAVNALIAANLSGNAQNREIWKLGSIPVAR